MTVRLSVAIAHLPGRDRWLPGMLDALRGLPVAVVEDRAREGCWPTIRRCWQAAAPGATHHLVLTDDLLICRDFPAAMARAVAAVPDRCVSPFCCNSVVFRAREAGGSWALTWKAWGPAVLLPVPWIAAFLAWEAAHVRPEHKHDDTRLTTWLMSRGERVWNTVPSLVEHDGAEESTLGNRPPIDRRSRWWIGPHASPLRIDWTAGRERPPCGSSVSWKLYRDMWRPGAAPPGAAVG